VTQQIACNRHQPEGLRPATAVCFVAAPQRCHRIACVAAPRIRPSAARNDRQAIS